MENFVLFPVFYQKQKSGCLTGSHFLFLIQAKTLLHALAGGLLGLDLLDGVAVAQVHAALVVDVGDLDPDHVADVDHVLHLLHPVVSSLEM